MDPYKWLKLSLQFSQELTVLTEETDFRLILQQSVLMLKIYASADYGLFLKLEDHRTASILAAEPPILRKFPVDLRPLRDLLEHKEMSWIAPFQPERDFRELLPEATTLALLPIFESNFQGWIVLGWKQTFVAEREFEEFLSIARGRMKEIVRLAHAHQSLTRFRARFNSILQTVPQALVFIEENGGSGWINRPAELLLGLPEGESSPIAISQAMLSLLTQADNQEQILNEAAHLFSNHQREIRDWKWLFTQPDRRILDVSSTPTVDNGIEGRLWMFSDVTTQYESAEALLALNQELQEKRKQADSENQAKSDFLSTMSHELRTPLNAVIGITYLMLMEDPKPEQVEHLQTLRFSADNLLALINDVLDFNKITSGEVEFESIAFSLTEVTSGIRQGLQVRAKDKGISLKVSIDPALPKIVEGDPVRLTQILTNLMSNALKFTHQGSVMLSLEVEREDKEGYQINFSVIDTGIGIPKDKIDTIFERFKQASSSTTRQYGGTGLGLSITKRLLNLQGSAIEVRSTVNEGSEFSFSLYLRKSITSSPLQLPGSQAEIVDLGSLSLQGLRILLVEDNKVNQLIASKFLRRWHAEVDCAENGAIAFQQIQNHVYDLVLMDIHMPIMDGYQTTQMIRNLKEKRFTTVPIIALTASTLNDPKERAYQAGMNDFIPKPFKPAEFYGIISKYTNQIN